MKKKIVDVSIIVLLVLMIVIGIRFYNEYKKYMNINKEWKNIEEKVVDDEFINVDWVELKGINKDIVAYIYVPYTNISFPVVKGETNDVYLRRNIYKNWSEMGSIFMDSNNESNFKDGNTIIYGHSTLFVNSMFTELKKFNNSTFVDRVKYFYILTPDCNYRCKIKAFAKTDISSSFYTYAMNEDIYHRIKKECSYFNFEIDECNDNFVTLSTCAVEHGIDTNERNVLLGKLEYYNGPIKRENDK